MQQVLACDEKSLSCDNGQELSCIRSQLVETAEMKVCRGKHRPWHQIVLSGAQVCLIVTTAKQFTLLCA